MCWLGTSPPAAPSGGTCTSLDIDTRQLFGRFLSSPGFLRQYLHPLTANLPTARLGHVPHWPTATACPTTTGSTTTGSQPPKDRIAQPSVRHTQGQGPHTRNPGCSAQPPSFIAFQPQPCGHAVQPPRVLRPPPPPPSCLPLYAIIQLSVHRAAVVRWLCPLPRRRACSSWASHTTNINTAGCKWCEQHCFYLTASNLTAPCVGDGWT